MYAMAGRFYFYVQFRVSSVVSFQFQTDAMNFLNEFRSHLTFEISFYEQFHLKTGTLPTTLKLFFSLNFHMR